MGIRHCAAVALAFFACGVIDIQAHGIWFAPRSGELALIYGEGGSDDPVVENRGRVQDLAAYDVHGAQVTVELVPADRLLLVKATQPPAVIAAVFDNGYWTMTADGREVNQSKSAVPGAKSGGHYIKYTVHLRSDLTKPLGVLRGQTLQITPVAPALPRRSGEPLALRVLFQGKPLAGAAVTADFVNDVAAAPLRTDAQGMVTVPVRNQGLNVISVAHTTPSDKPQDADLVEHRATLSFVLAPAAH